MRRIDFRFRCRPAARFLFCTLAACAMVGSALAPVGAGTPARPKAADFTTVDVNGTSHTLAQYLNAKPILLEFMSPDCPHCLDMAPILTRVHPVYGTKVQFLTVAFDKSARRMQQFALLEKHTWPYLMGTQAIIDAYKLEGVPTFYFLAPDG